MNKKKPKTLSSIGEQGLIEYLTQTMKVDSSVVRGIGDDCAVLNRNKVWYDLFKTDMVIEDIHFTFRDCTPEQIGYKALARNISDIAAMGGMPTYAVVAIGLPVSSSVNRVKRIFKGIEHLARRYGISIVGGDTSHARELFIAISLLGRVEKKRVVYRNGARVGDVIFVTGSFGGSIIKKHKTFSPRLHEARFLVEHFSPHAMIDVSDGLARDLGNILAASHVGARVYAENIPLSSDVCIRARRLLKNPLDLALHDGEDYELVFTISQNQVKRLQYSWNQKISTTLTAIGTIVKEQEFSLLTVEGKKETITRGK
jgi:thiamine-monophosphate kinase